MSQDFPPNDPFAFFRQFWQPSNPALQSFMPALSEEEIERKLIMQALEETRWNRTAAAQRLGLTFRSMRYRLKKLGID